MKLISNLKAGEKLSPALIIFIYFLFVLLDLFTTYLATPDLKYEGNPIVRYFHLNWIQFISYYLFIAIITSIGFLIGISWINKFYSGSITCGRSLLYDIMHNKKILFSFILFGTFYSHFINIAHIIVNNYLSIIYLHKPNNVLKNLAFQYISLQPFFLNYFKIVPVIIGYLFAWYQMGRHRTKVMNQQVSDMVFNEL